MICFPEFGLLKSPTSPLRGSVTLEPGLFQPFSSVSFSWFLSLRRWIETFTNFPWLTTNLGAHRATPCRLEDESSRVTNATKISCYELKCSRMNFALFSSISQSLNPTLFFFSNLCNQEWEMLKGAVEICISLWGSAASTWRGEEGFIPNPKKLAVKPQRLPGSEYPTPCQSIRPLPERFCRIIRHRVGVSDRFQKVSVGLSDTVSDYPTPLFQLENRQKNGHNFWLRSPILVILDSMESLFRGLSNPTEIKLQNHFIKLLSSHVSS